MPESSHHPIFVIGAPRSGTTVLGASLARHSELWTSAESAYLTHLFGDRRIRKVLAKARAQPSPSWIAAESVSDEEFMAFLGRGLNALYTSRSGGKRWVDATPLNTLMAEDLAALFPGARFIHLLRDGRRVVHSMLHFIDKFQPDRREQMSEHIGSWTTDFREACRAWRGYVDVALDFAARYPDRCLTVRNERLADAPARGFEEILAFLGLPDEPGPANHFAKRRVNSSFPAEWRDGRQHTLASPEPWQDWTPEERGCFAEEAGVTMARAGIARDAVAR